MPSSSGIASRRCCALQKFQLHVAQQPPPPTCVQFFLHTTRVNEIPCRFGETTCFPSTRDQLFKPRCRLQFHTTLHANSPTLSTTDGCRRRVMSLSVTIITSKLSRRRRAAAGAANFNGRSRRVAGSPRSIDGAAERDKTWALFWLHGTVKATDS